MQNVFNAQLSRRQFLRTAAIVAGAAALSGSWVARAAEAKSSAAAVEENVWIPTTCLSCAPHVKCSHLVHRVDGIAVRVRGNPASPTNLGKNCSKANSMISQLYSPYRVKFPVKRTNPQRGPGVDPKWVEISWEEAFDTVAKKLQEVRADDPRKLMLTPGHVGPNLLQSFASAFGTPNVMSAATSTFCGGGSATMNSWLLGEGHAYPDMPYSKYVINFGAQSVQGAKGTPKQLYDYIQGRDQGVHVVNVAPMVTASTAKADEWVPIRPGTAMPFSLSMADVLVNELNAYDADFLKNKTNAPYLVGPDGKYLRDNTTQVEDKARGGQVGKPLVWDANAGAAKTFDDPTLGDMALDGSFTVNGVQARTVFRVLKEHLQQYTPDKTESITTVPADTVRRLAREWADNASIGSVITLDGVTMPYRPVAAIAESGAKGHIDDDHIVQSVLLLCELVGAIGVPGGMKSAAPPTLNTNPADGIVASALSYRPVQYPSAGFSPNTLYPFLGPSSGLACLAASDPQTYKTPYFPEVLGFQGGNIYRLGTDGANIDEFFQKLKFIFAVSLVFDEPTELADIVFPESSWLERYGFQSIMPHGSLSDADKKGGFGTSIYHPVVNQVFDTRNGDDVWLELARRVGIAEGPKGMYSAVDKLYNLEGAYALPQTGNTTWSDVVDHALRAKHGDDHGLDWFEKNGLLVQKPVKVSDVYAAAKYPKARYPIYFEEFVGWHERLAKEIQEKGIQYKPSNDFVLNSFQPLPVWREHPEHTAPDTHPLYAVNFKIMELFYGNIDWPWMNEWAASFDPYAMAVLVNPKSAAALGLQDGSNVVVESFTGGKTSGQVKVTNLVTPEVIAIGGAWGAMSVHVHPWARRGPHFNSLYKLSEEFIDPLRGSVDLTTRVRLIKA